MKRIVGTDLDTDYRHQLAGVFTGDEERRRAALQVASRVRDPAECLRALDMLGLLPEHLASPRHIRKRK